MSRQSRMQRTAFRMFVPYSGEGASGWSEKKSVVAKETVKLAKLRSDGSLGRIRNLTAGCTSEDSPPAG